MDVQRGGRPDSGWEVYANREQFHDEQGITLIADATKLAAQNKLKDGVGLPEPPLYYPVADFVRSATEAKPSVCSADEGYRSGLVVLAAHQALMTGTEQKLAEQAFKDLPEVTTWRLRDLTLPGRLGVTCLLLVIAGGLWASMEHLEDHHENRDSKPGVSLNDLKGAYHGVWLPPALEAALNRNHPEQLPEADKTNLLKWLKSKSPNELYDKRRPRRRPAEILARNCVSCHGRKSSDPSKIGETMPSSSGTT
jgi:hypothetical protein